MGQLGSAEYGNITERKKAEKELGESEARYRSLFSSMNEGVCLHELVYNESGKAVDYKIIDVNPAYEKIIGIKRNDATEKICFKTLRLG